jgi:hypothetical protein
MVIFIHLLDMLEHEIGVLWMPKALSTSRWVGLTPDKAPGQATMPGVRSMTWWCVVLVLARSGALTQAMQDQPPSWSCRVSLFAQALLVDLLCAGDSSLSVMLIAVFSGKSWLLRAGLRTGTHHRCRLLRKVFTSRTRWMSLYPSSKRCSKNNLWYLNTWFLCLSILASLRIPQLILRW